jgi:hypothetical protein
MQINTKIIADSRNESGQRITTMVVTFPRYILAELNTHRMLSKNSASSRAIPFEKLLKSVEENPFVPIAWMKDHSGMQGSEYFEDEKSISELNTVYLHGRDSAVKRAKMLSGLGLTKQIVNRGLEPYMWHTVIITATDWENFFALRCPRYQHQNGKIFRSWKDLVKNAFDAGASRDWVESLENHSTLERLKCNTGQADIHMMALAESIWDSYNNSVANILEDGEWHIPFGDNIPGDALLGIVNDDEKYNDDPSYLEKVIDDAKIKIATARCARISYTVVGEENKPVNYANDIKLHDRLASSGHWSPFEHCAQATSISELNNIASGNFNGFMQYRKKFANENITL